MAFLTDWATPSLAGPIPLGRLSRKNAISESGCRVGAPGRDERSRYDWGTLGSMGPQGILK